MDPMATLPNRYSISGVQRSIYSHVGDVKSSQIQFFQTIVYAFNEVAEREPLWSNLKRLSDNLQGPWSIGGDFNCVLYAKERMGGNVTNAESELFQDCLDYCCLTDIKAIGSFYTWNNKQPPDSRVYSRLDKFLVNNNWMVRFPEYFANFLPEGNFDYSPCLVAKDTRHLSKNRPFKYFNMWSSAPSFQEKVQAMWNIRIEGTKMQLAKQLGNVEMIQEEYDLLQLHKNLQHSRMEFLKQKAKAHWIKEGDCNTAYFHGVIKSRRNKNFIYQMKDHKGQMHAVCTNQHMHRLLQTVTADEIKDTMFHIPNDKAPGPNEFSSKFCKDTWDMMGGGEITAAIMDFFNSGSLLKQLNATTITLIPKVDRHTTVYQYRPIACCNVIYKCISKIICNRLSGVLPDIISPNQGGFIQGRSIMENILIFKISSDYMGGGATGTGTRRSSIPLTLYHLHGIIDKTDGSHHNGQWFQEFFMEWGVDYTRTPLVSWDKICKPKSEGGLGLKDDAIWNQTAIGKLVWWIFDKPDHLWVKWVNHIYIKQKTWIAYRQQVWKKQKGLDYTVAKGYDYLRDRGDKVQWYELVWHKWSTPKHSILA
ncbi:uncharacterized protein LOC141651444 [Silene latifolia]|uniref:uncharacterized protein LOC141651444 n=1 Tax=Silene latifolia TaxID=37657 RepID=UPI003D777C2F